MIGKERIVAFIPARGGSKGIKNKNIKMLYGKPLIAWTIEHAKASKYIDRIIVSTEDELIARVAKEWGAEVIFRPSELAQDHSLVIDAIKHTIELLKKHNESADKMVLLQPTSPLRKVESIDKCIEKLHSQNLDSVATFTEAELNPHRAWKIVNQQPQLFIQNAIPWLPRQELPDAYQLNGAVYAFKMENLLKEKGSSVLVGHCGAVIMNYKNSIDIDNEIHWKLVELLIQEEFEKN